MHSIFLACLLLAPAFVLAQDLTPEVALALKELPPDLEARRYATGDLDGDGKRDVAVLVFRGSGHEFNESIVVLLKTDSGYRIADRSQEWSFHERRYDDISIDQGVLSLLTEGASSCCARYAQEIKFRLRNGAFLLVGEEAHQGGVAVDDRPEWDERESINYLSGKVLYEGQEGTAKPWKKAGRFKAGRVPLSAFNYYDYREKFPGLRDD